MRFGEEMQCRCARGSSRVRDGPLFGFLSLEPARRSLDGGGALSLWLARFGRMLGSGTVMLGFLLPFTEFATHFGEAPRVAAKPRALVWMAWPCSATDR